AAAAEPGARTGLDVVFPVLHGTFGEDGTIQGLFELADVAYVGSGVLGSAAGMDKDAMKRLFLAAGLPITPHVSMLRSEWRVDGRRATKAIEKALKYPLFVKPANLGGSVGISKVHNRAELGPAMDLAASFDRKIVVEQGVGGPGVKPRELEVAVLGNDAPEASVVGEIVPAREFYDYEAKYELSDDAGFRRIITQHRDLKLARLHARAAHPLLDDDLAIKARGEIHGRPQLRAIVHLTDAHRASQVRRLHEERILQSFLNGFRRPPSIHPPFGPQHRYMRCDGQPSREKQPLHRILVHASRRAQNSGANVGDVGQLKQPLYRAVFAEGSVQYREDYIEACACTGFCSGRNQSDAALTARAARLLAASKQIPGRAAGEPAASFGDAELDNVVLFAVDCLKDRAGGAERDLVLAAATAEENTNAKFLAGHLFQFGADRACACARGRPMNLVVHLYSGSGCSQCSLQLRGTRRLARASNAKR